jgi:hypothetical protein
VGERVPGGGEVVAQAASAFSDAFTLTNTVALGIALAAAAAVLAFSRRRGDEGVGDEAIDGYDFDQLAVAAGDMRE